MARRHAVQLQRKQRLGLLPARVQHQQGRQHLTRGRRGRRQIGPQTGAIEGLLRDARIEGDFGGALRETGIAGRAGQFHVGAIGRAGQAPLHRDLGGQHAIHDVGRQRQLGQRHLGRQRRGRGRLELAVAAQREHRPVGLGAVGLCLRACRIGLGRPGIARTGAAGQRTGADHGRDQQWQQTPAWRCAARAGRRRRLVKRYVGREQSEDAVQAVRHGWDSGTRRAI